MVKLQKRFAYKYKDKEHYKHVITIPDTIVSKLNWSDGKEITFEVKDSRLILTSDSRKETKKR